MEAVEPCPKCGCFWREHDQERCCGVGTKKDNLWVTHGHYYPEVMEILKRIVEDSRSEEQQPCPLCSDDALHDWLECLRMARYKPFMLLDCDVVVRPPMGPEEVAWLQWDSLLWVEDDTNGKPTVKSHMPQCQFCNCAQPVRFPLECTQAWEGWEIWRYPCYKCKQEEADHMSEECWVVRDC